MSYQLSLAIKQHLESKNSTGALTIAEKHIHTYKHVGFMQTEQQHVTMLKKINHLIQGGINT